MRLSGCKTATKKASETKHIKRGVRVPPSSSDDLYIGVKGVVMVVLAWAAPCFFVALCLGLAGCGEVKVAFVDGSSCKTKYFANRTLYGPLFSYTECRAKDCQAVNLTALGGTVREVYMCDTGQETADPVSL